MYWVIMLTFTYMFCVVVPNNLKCQWEVRSGRLTRMIIHRINIESWERVYQGERKGEENSVYTKGEEEQSDVSSGHSKVGLPSLR